MDRDPDTSTSTAYHEGRADALAAVLRVGEHWQEHTPGQNTEVGTAWLRRAVGAVRAGWCCDVDHPDRHTDDYEPLP